MALAVVVCFVCTSKRGRLSPPPPGGKGRDRVTSAALRGRIPSSLPRPPRNLSGFGEEQRARGPFPPSLSPPFLSEPFSAFRLGRGDRPAPASPTLPPTPIPGFRPCWETNEKMEIGSLSLSPFSLMHAFRIDASFSSLFPPTFPITLQLDGKKASQRLEYVQMDKVCRVL